MKRAEYGIILFSKLPHGIEVKSRLSNTVSEEGKAVLMGAFLDDIIEECQRTSFDIILSYCGDVNADNIEYLERCRNNFPQVGETLEEKMANAFETVFKDGYEKVILIGTDIPEIRAMDLMEAFSCLDSNDIVLGPSVDGGYYLIGMKEFNPDVFSLDTDRKSSGFNMLSEYLTNKGYSLGFTEKKFDIDSLNDVFELRKRIENIRDSHLLNTRFVLERLSLVSVIIPVYNEEKYIEKLIAQLKYKREDCQIIFADGGSTDRTREIIESQGFTVVDSKKGRGNQMNEGAKYAGGNILFFLHCDSILPEDFIHEIIRVMDLSNLGFFGIEFDDRSVLMKICARQSNRRAEEGIVFGDQGMFVRRLLFDMVGGFKNLPIMEDFQFSIDMKKRGYSWKRTEKPIRTSSRRYPKCMIRKLLLMYKMFSLRKKYLKGEDVEKLAEAYGEKR